MPEVRTRNGNDKQNREQLEEPYPLNEFPEEIIQSIAKQIIRLKATGHVDMSGDQFDRIFAESIEGFFHGKPIGLVDVSLGKCCWSVKTIKTQANRSPFTLRNIRLISGRNNVIFSAGIENAFEDIAKTGKTVIDIYNQRIDETKQYYNRLRLLVLVRNMQTMEFVIYEHLVNKFISANYQWRINRNNNLEAFDGDRHAFTWQPNGSQFTILEDIPDNATKFRINRDHKTLELQEVLRIINFDPNWVEIL